VANGFKINKDAIARMTREIQAEFDKHPISVGVEAEAKYAALVTNNYNGPTVVVSGDHANVERIVQNQTTVQPIAAGYEELAVVVTEALRKLADVPLSDESRAVALEAGEEIVAEVERSEPGRDVIKRASAVLMGVLAPLALAVQAGVDEGAQEWAKFVIEQLTGLTS